MVVRTLTLILLAVAGFGQTRQFDVASVKALGAGQVGMIKYTTDPGRLRAEFVDVKELMAYAYDVSPLVIAGSLPATRFDVEGRAEGAHTRAELRVMLQGLLAERFGLQMHREMRELTVDALVAGKSPKLQASDETDADPRGFHMHSSKLRGHVAVEGHAISLAGLANYLSTHHRERLIVDATGMKGLYDFEGDYEVDYERIADRSIPESESAAVLMEGLAASLGLRIELGRRMPVEMLVVDRVLGPDPD